MVMSSPTICDVRFLIKSQLNASPWHQLEPADRSRAQCLVERDVECEPAVVADWIHTRGARLIPTHNCHGVRKALQRCRVQLSGRVYVPLARLRVEFAEVKSWLILWQELRR